MLRAQHLVAVGLVAIGVAIVGGAPAPAWAFGQDGGTETSTGTAPANGTMVTQTDDIPATATEGSFGVQPMDGTDAHAFDEITTVLVQDFPWLAKTSKRSQATLACVMLSYLPYASKPIDEPVTFSDVQLQVMLLSVCLKMAASIPQPAAARDARAAPGACGRLNAAVTVKITHSRSGYRGVVSSKIRTAKNSRLTVTCRRSGKGLVLTVRPRKRGQTLRAAGGPTLALAYNNPTTKPVGLRTTFKVN